MCFEPTYQGKFLRASGKVTQQQAKQSQNVCQMPHLLSPLTDSKDVQVVARLENFHPLRRTPSHADALNSAHRCAEPGAEEIAPKLT